MENKTMNICQCFHDKGPKGTARARGVLMVKILNKCILTILVY